MHSYGQEAKRAVEEARGRVADMIVADMINAAPHEIVWTSGATEAINLAIKGIACTADIGGHIITSMIEHKAVLDTCRHLEKEGFRVTYVQPDESGLVTPDMIRSNVQSDTLLVSLMHVNNELGTITDIEAVGEMLADEGIIFHVDAVQSAARIPLDVKRSRVDMLSLSAHKMYGPKGIGALYVCNDSDFELQPQLHGGGHERGLRSGTLATHQVVGMGVAASLVEKSLNTDQSGIEALSDCLVTELLSCEGVIFNSDRAHCVPGILNVRFDGVASEALMMLLKDNVAISSGSACTSESVEPSHVLKAIGLSEDDSYSSVRISLGRFTSEQDIIHAIKRITSTVKELRDLKKL